MMGFFEIFFETELVKRKIIHTFCTFQVHILAYVYVRTYEIVFLMFWIGPKKKKRRNREQSQIVVTTTLFYLFHKHHLFTSIECVCLFVGWFACLQNQLAVIVDELHSCS